MTVRSIAFHLPQYHPIAENDQWWGKGFTEWTNVTKTQPQYPGHDQPHLPADLGFYDLRLPEAREAQAQLAKQYGIHGFCYYHYWFNGHRLLERPFNEILKSGKPDFPFCLCWANENWSRRWDGLDQEVLMGQNYGDQDDVEHIRWLIEAFRDPRYIRVQGRPLLMVYKISHLPDPTRTAKLWREEAQRQGIGDIFICNVESAATEHGLAPIHGLDGAVEFAPDWKELPPKKLANRFTNLLRNRPRLQNLMAELGLTQPWLNKHQVYAYPQLVANMMKKSQADYLRFPCVSPMWDNSARRQTDATILDGSTPEIYQEWLSSAVDRAKAIQSKDPIVFINAWNEWAEGNHLEPCQRYGHAYLEATRDALSMHL